MLKTSKSYFLKCCRQFNYFSSTLKWNEKSTVTLFIRNINNQVQPQFLFLPVDVTFSWFYKLANHNLSLFAYGAQIRGIEFAFYKSLSVDIVFVVRNYTEGICALSVSISCALVKVNYESIAQKRPSQFRIFKIYFIHCRKINGRHV